MLGLRKVVAMYKQMKYISHVLNLFILRNYINCDNQPYGLYPSFRIPVEKLVNDLYTDTGYF